MVEPGFEPGAAGWEARILPLCCAASPRAIMIALAIIELLELISLLDKSNYRYTMLKVETSI